MVRMVTVPVGKFIMTIAVRNNVEALVLVLAIDRMRAAAGVAIPV